MDKRGVREEKIAVERIGSVVHFLQKHFTHPHMHICTYASKNALKLPRKKIRIVTLLTSIRYHSYRYRIKVTTITEKEGHHYVDYVDICSFKK